MGRTVRVAAACLIALTTTYAHASAQTTGGSAPGGNPTLTDIDTSLLFGNPAVHDAFMDLPFTVYNLTNNGFGLSLDPQSPGARLRRSQIALYQVWQDPSSIKLLAYLWSNAHRSGDDLVFDPCLVAGYGTCPVDFLGKFGVCDRGVPVVPAGFARDQSLIDDVKCQHWLSALFAAQQNNLGYHNLIGVNGATSKPDVVSASGPIRLFGLVRLCRRPAHLAEAVHPAIGVRQGQRSGGRRRHENV